MASYRIVSTSGIPHGDVADYRRSPEWRSGMPVGANRAWRTYMQEAIAQVTASSPDVVLHQGDAVQGRWYKYEYPDDPRVYGRRRTWAEKTHAGAARPQPRRRSGAVQPGRTLVGLVEHR